MSLQVWLTGNNSMNNQGLLGELTQTTAPTYVDGKLGKAMSTGGYKMTAEQTAQVLNNEAVSICFWVYINADTGTNAQVLFFGNDDMGSNNNRKFTLFNYPTVNDFHWSWMSDTASYPFTYGILSGVLPSYKWTHVAITYQNPNGTIYINGEKIYTFTGVSDSSTFAYETPVIHNSSYLRWNDYRIYNHCLSAKEVKEISKGLVCHYKLSDPYLESTTNLAVKDGVSGWNNSGNSTLSSSDTTLNSSKPILDCPIYSIIETSAGNSALTFSHISASQIAGKTITASTWVWISENTSSMIIYIRSSKSDNSIFHLCYNGNDNPQKWPKEKWIYIEGTGTVASDETYVYFCTYANNLNEKRAFNGWQIEVKDHATPYVNGSRNETIVSDCSGFGNDGTKVGDIAWNGDSPRYNGSYKFPTTACIDCGTGGKVKDEITVSIWCNMDTLVTEPRLISCTESGGWNFESNNGKIQFPVYVDSGYIIVTSSKLWTDLASGWHMFTGTYDGYNAKLYIDGELDKTTSNGKSNKTGIGYNSTNHIYIHAEASDNSYYPGYNECNLSDCRIYATALSAEDVKELYNVSASIYKSGALAAYEFVEEGC